MFQEQMLVMSRALIDKAREKGVKLAAAESCTGGLLSALLTEIPGSSKAFERGFVVYSNRAKQEMLGVPGEIIADHGAVSETVAIAMAEGAISASRADYAVSITGVAGPSGGTALKPVGLVHFGLASKNGLILSEVCKFGDVGRAEVRRKSLIKAMDLLSEAIDRG
ncbi:MAG: damage-inducible protein CinA [Hirschia sp.]|nr:damage-inducible protein CinA [Hirschia sp.]MBF17998.1 damage-inducible protein CinA [Hirschia sp.]|tara:strand:- start:413 stop:910 length:498 start_codon:yes stop_codon:yes gene_type:complete